MVKSLIKRPCNYFLVLYNSLFYTQLTFVFHLQTNFYIRLLQCWHFLFFSSSERFLYLSQAHLCFLFLFSTERFWQLWGPFFEAFFCFFDNTQLKTSKEVYELMLFDLVKYVYSESVFNTLYIPYMYTIYTEAQGSSLQNCVWDFPFSFPFRY